MYGCNLDLNVLVGNSKVGADTGGATRVLPIAQHAIPLLVASTLLLAYVLNEVPLGVG